MQLFYGWQVNLWLLLILWLRMAWTAFVRTPRTFSEPVAAA